MNRPVIYVFLNKSLQMSVGKASAQAVHAAMMANVDIIDDTQRGEWKKAVHKTVIVLEARDEQHMRNIASYLVERAYAVHYIIDEGVNEILPHTVTAMATTILDKDSEDVEKAFSSFSLYRDVIKVNLEINR